MLTVLSILIVACSMAVVVVAVRRPPTTARQCALFAAIGTSQLGTALLFTQVLPKGIFTNVSVATVIGGAMLFFFGAYRAIQRRRQRET